MRDVVVVSIAIIIFALIAAAVSGLIGYGVMLAAMTFTPQVLGMGVAAIFLVLFGLVLRAVIATD